MSTIRIVHLSDIHFGQEIDGSRPEHDDIRQALLRDCKDEMVGKLGPANGLVVTGDIAYSGKKKEYERAGDWLDELAKIVGCKKNAVHTIPGNHDVDLAGITYTCELLHKELRNCAADKVDEILAKIAPDTAEVSPLLDKLGSYMEFASRYESDFETAGRPISRKEIKFSTGHVLRFLGLNSVQVSDKSDAPRKMVLGNRQYIFSEEQDVEYVVMTHHPLEWFKDKSQAYPRLINRGRVILTGHEHEAAFRKVQENGREHVVIDAGATSPPGGGEKRPHTYNWIEFTLGHDREGHLMTVAIHPRVWVLGRARFEADKNRLGGEASVAHVIRCPNYGERQAPEVTAPEVTPSIPIGVHEGEAADMADDEKFARLLYYFWRYLDWRERYGVLAKVDVLPKGLEKPVPQVLERNALAMARSQNKLGKVWDEVMTKVPEGQKELNPFEGGDDVNQGL